VPGVGAGPLQLTVQQREPRPHVFEQLEVGGGHPGVGAGAALQRTLDHGAGGALLPRADAPAHLGDGHHQGGLVTNDPVQPAEGDGGVDPGPLVGLQEGPLAGQHEAAHGRLLGSQRGVGLEPGHLRRIDLVDDGHPCQGQAPQGDPGGRSHDDAEDGDERAEQSHPSMQRPAPPRALHRLGRSGGRR